MYHYTYLITYTLKNQQSGSTYHNLEEVIVQCGEAWELEPTFFRLESNLPYSTIEQSLNNLLEPDDEYAIAQITRTTLHNGSVVPLIRTNMNETPLSTKINERQNEQG